MRLKGSRSGGGSHRRFRVGRAGAENEHLLSVAFDYVFGKSVAYALDRFDSNINISAITDTLDETILDEFRQRAINFLAVGDPKEIQAAGSHNSPGESTSPSRRSTAFYAR